MFGEQIKKMSKHSNYIKELDGIRALAALMVMFGHYFTTHKLEGNTINNLLQQVFSFSQAGVTIFFILSGFLITRILINTKDHKDYFKYFYMRRLLRIFPLYYLFLILYYFALPLLLHQNYASFNQQIWYWLYLQNISDTFVLGASGPAHFWSLAVEEQFYLFWPIIIFLIPNKKIGKLAIATFLLANILRIIMLFQGYKVYYFTFARMDELAMGALLAYLFMYKPKLLKSHHLLIAFIVSLTLMIAVRIAMPGNNILWIQAIKYPLISIPALFFIAYIISTKKNTILHHILNTNFLKQSGRISYGLYVFHPLCFLLVDHYFSDTYKPLHFTLAFGSTFIISFLSFNYFETRFTKLKSRYNYQA